MTEQPDQREKLLAETFHADWTDGPAGGFARRAAAHARGRRLRRRALVGTVALAAALALAVLPRLMTVSPTSESAEIATSGAQDYEIISNAELLAQMRGRPVLSIHNADGSHDLVLLSAEIPSSPSS